MIKELERRVGRCSRPGANALHGRCVRSCVRNPIISPTIQLRDSDAAIPKWVIVVRPRFLQRVAS